MKLDDLMRIPHGMDIDEYNKQLKKMNRLEKRIRKLSEMIDFETDLLNILSDERGSDRYKRHLKSLVDAMADRKSLIIKYNKIARKLKRDEIIIL